MKSFHYRIGIIITVYNKAEYLHRALYSVIRQLSLPDSLYIINDCSSDSSSVIIADLIPLLNDKIGTVKYLNLTKNCGAAEARNKALEIATDDYIIFLDADDYYELSYISSIRKILKSITNVGMICSAVRMESNGQKYPSRRVFKTFTRKKEIYYVRAPLRTLSNESIFIGGGNVCFRRINAIHETFDPNEENMEEWDFYYRVLKNCLNTHFNIIFNPDICYNYNNLDIESLSRKKILDFSTIKVPKIISSLTDEHEKAYKAFLISIWVYNSMIRLPERKSKIKFLKEYKTLFFQMSINRYWLGALFTLINNAKILNLIKKQFKRRWYK